ncbi:hypothetical protein Nepgr_006849 [Nepenthes gracilis]|uniref:Uncharacterized protein n=1 Tax=Nepenthes gracilis TaxID=150966 RepID=A0AAD3XHR9_NEPGR|nr:hypothetical protein Nepgr_006849 [Nepenthes gracilis]
MVIRTEQDLRPAFDKIQDNVAEDGELLIGCSGEWPDMILSGLPLQYFRKNVLWDIGRVIGEPISVDTNTFLNVAHGQF